MKKLLILIASLYAAGVSASVLPMACNPDTVPKQVQKLQDYEIIATNVSTIDATPAFHGTNLNYFVKASPHSKKNTVKIDRHKGIITIKADAKDNFDVIVTAKNVCGNAMAKFNVQIDEEE